MCWEGVRNKPPIVILLATYNGEKYLRDLLDSVFAQTYDNWTLLVSDDASTDATLQILKEYQQKYLNKICILENDHASGSACGNFFRLMRHCDGEYMMFCDQDDVWEPNKVEITLQSLLNIERINEKRPVMVFTDLVVVDDKLTLIAPSFMRFSKLSANRIRLNQLLIQNVITGCTMMLNRPLCDKALEVQNKENIMMHDWWIGLIASAFGDVGYVDQATIKYRQHGENEVGAKNTRSLSYILNRLLKKHDITQSLRQTTMQAGELFAVFGDRMSERDQMMVKGYAHLYQRSKPSRLMFLLKYRIFKYGAARKLAQIIWV